MTFLFQNQSNLKDFLREVEQLPVDITLTSEGVKVEIFDVEEETEVIRLLKKYGIGND